MNPRSDTPPTLTERSDPPTSSAPERSDNTASAVIESPQKPGRKNPLDPHDFAEGGGGGGGEAYSRVRVKRGPALPKA